MAGRRQAARRQTHTGAERSAARRSARVHTTERGGCSPGAHSIARGAGSPTGAKPQDPRPEDAARSAPPQEDVPGWAPQPRAVQPPPLSPPRSAQLPSPSAETQTAAGEHSALPARDSGTRLRGPTAAAARGSRDSDWLPPPNFRFPDPSPFLRFPRPLNSGDWSHFPLERLSRATPEPGSGIMRSSQKRRITESERSSQSPAYGAVTSLVGR